MTQDNALALSEDNQIQNLIYTVRGKQVLIDSDLAVLYQVSTKRLNEQVARNKNRCDSCNCRKRQLDYKGPKQI
ncbi:MAG: ORF6N domain-containing protein [Clostridiaceae bacterium]|nr:ORF6N domain-containing protein [Clostridiaceae bacterium]